MKLNKIIRKGLCRQAAPGCSLNRDGNFRNEKGIALVMVLILSAISLAIMAALVYMLTVSTQVSGIQKRYKTALEAGKGGAQVAYKLIGARGGDFNIPGLTNKIITVSNACLTAKLNSATSQWTAADPNCSSTMSIDTTNSASYDMYFEIGNTAVYKVYTKIVDTVNGNSSGDAGLLKSGVVSSNSGEITVMSMPYLYSIEVEAENKDNPQERGKYSILYEY